jgi:hypothetical protein
MRFAILPLVIRRESQFVSAGDDVLIRCRSSWMRNFGPNDAAQDTPDRPTASLFFVAVVPMECLTSSKTHPQNDLQQLHGFPASVMVLPITSRLNRPALLLLGHACSHPGLKAVASILYCHCRPCIVLSPGLFADRPVELIERVAA